MTERDQVDRRIWWGSVSVIALAGLLLRLAASQGGLWTDEAWSMIYAQQARDPLGVFLRINHDNNHHLISLWLQLIGIGAPPWLARFPSVLAGTASIVVAAMIVARRSAIGGTVAALLFAVSPIMLTYGSEARGYAPMMFAALTMLLLVMRMVEKESARFAPWWVGLVSLLGMLSHLTMAAPVALITLWVYLDRRKADGPRPALRSTVHMMGPALAAAAAVPILVVAAGMMSPNGMRVGGYVPFEWRDLLRALGDLTAWTFGLITVPAWLPLGGAILMTAIIAVRRPQWLGPRSLLYAILILSVPLAVSIVHSGNIGFARYFLCSAIGLLLLSSELIGHELKEKSGRHAGAATVLSALLLTSLWQDSSLIRIARGRPDKIVQLMRQSSPVGSRVALDTDRLEAVTRVAAAQAGYRADLVRGCAPADFLVSSDPKRLASPGPLVHCGVTMRPVGSGSGSPLSGDRWILYAAYRPSPLNVANR